MVAAMAKTPRDLHEWISFEDAHEQRRWVFDVTFLLSPWTCIFGQGCQGVLTGPAEDLVQGCCSYGAHFIDDEDVARVEAAAATLDATQWQFINKAKGGITKTSKDGEVTTKLVDSACIFLNRKGFAKGPGCALHQVAMERGTSYIDLKPEVCWQLPLRREEAVDAEGYVTTTITEWDRKHWGPGGEEFHWWCTEDARAFVGHGPVYRTMRDELVAMVGATTYAQLAAYLDDKVTTKVAVAHPTLRAKKRPKA